MTTRLILLLLMAIDQSFSTPHSVLERYEERLNSALSKRTGVPRTVKRYKCVEEYVTYDQHGRAVTSYQGSKFTTTMEPPTYRSAPEREIRRKPAKKVTIAINRDSEETTTPITLTTTTEIQKESTTSLKPFDEMNDEEADRIIEEMYLKKKESHAGDSPETPSEVAEIVTESPKPLPPPPPPQQPIQPPSPPKTRSYSTSSSSSSNSGVQRYRSKVDSEDNDDEDYPRSMYPRRGGSRKRPYDMSTYDDYDDIPLYRPLRREYRRRRPIFVSDEFSDDSDFSQRGNPRRQTTRDLSPLRPINTLRHIPSYNPPPQYRQPIPPPPMSLPVSSSTNMIHRPLPLPMAPPMRHPSAPGPHHMMGMPPGMGHPYPPPPQPLQPIQQQQSMNPGNEVLKMKPILQANPQEMQVATEESCAKITTLAKSFNIKDVSKWARGNCAFLQAYAPTASCDLIFHFIDSCRSKKFF